MFEYIKSFFKKEDNGDWAYPYDYNQEERNEWIQSPFRKQGYVSFAEDRERWRLRLKHEKDKETRMKRKIKRYSRFR